MNNVHCFEVGKIYSCGRYITHTPLKFIKVIDRKGKTLTIEDITGRQFTKKVLKEVTNNSEQLYTSCSSFTMPSNFYATDEVSELEWKFLIENFDSIYPPAEVTYEGILKFFADYIKPMLKETIQTDDTIKIHVADQVLPVEITIKIEENIVNGQIIGHDIKYYRKGKLLGITFGAEEHECLLNNELNKHNIRQEIRRLMMIKEENESIMSEYTDIKTKADIKAEGVKILHHYHIDDQLTIKVPFTTENNTTGHYILTIVPFYLGKFEYHYYIEHDGANYCMSIQNVWANIRHKIHPSLKRRLATSYPLLVDFLQKYDY